MANTKKSVKKVSRTVIVKKEVAAPCMCGCCENDSVKYTSIWAAWRAFWRRGFCEWAGTSSRSEYWLSWIGNLLVLLIGLLVLVLFGALEIKFFGQTGFLAWIIGSVLILYVIAAIIPAISMMTRRMHDAGLSAWLWLIYFADIAPAYVSEAWVYGPAVSLIVALLPTQVIGNRFHKNNK
ncbi:MAG: DUF805 domain-containing protein [Alphaproteobacteria bacterium]|nr:DUF805 domain-containing protein [Alphaproteobacteria bacterium]